MPTLVPKTAPRWFTDPIVDGLARAGVTPNMLTVAGVAGNLVAAVLAARGEFVPAGLLVLAASSLDMLDGALARATGKATDFGSVFDSVMDRVSEAAVLFGLLVYFGDIGRTEDQQLAFIAVVSSLLVSYIRARAEIVGVTLREGLFSRAPRVLVLSAGLILEPYWDVWESSVHIMLWVLAIMSTFTAAQRLVLVWMKTRGEDRNEK
jgi:CDP-diacylglycerol---glycerol-3-phosphate 3-phosphatidyltransferase